MELTILGASGSYPTAHSPCSGYLVRTDGYAMWMDAGNGTLSALQRHVPFADVDAVVLSHVHLDHCADFFPYFYALMCTEMTGAVPVYTPPGVRERLEHLIGGDSIERFRALLDWHELSPGAREQIGPFDVSVFDAAHSTANNTMRIEGDGKILCYSGDTGPNEHLQVAAVGADLFLCEASWVNGQGGIMPPIHLTAGEAGQSARDAGAQRLLMTHVWPDNDLDLMAEQAGAHFDGPIEFAVRTETTKV